MINHIRTLLLNLPACRLAEPPWYEEYIDPAFYPMNYPDELRAVHGLLVPQYQSRLDRIMAVYGLLRLTAMTDFKTYAERHDPRVTYSLDDPKYLSYPGSGFSGMRATCNSIFGLVAGGGALFKKTIYPDDVAELQRIWLGGVSLLDRMAAVTLAVVYRMEDCRAGRY